MIRKQSFRFLFKKKKQHTQKTTKQDEMKSALKAILTDST